jgi:hypothetical protein
MTRAILILPLQLATFLDDCNVLRIPNAQRLSEIPFRGYAPRAKAARFSFLCRRKDTYVLGQQCRNSRSLLSGTTCRHLVCPDKLAVITSTFNYILRDLSKF